MSPYNAIFSWKSKEVSKEVIKPPRSKKNILSPIVEDTATREKVRFNEDGLIQDQITYTLQTIVNIYIVYEITKKNPVNIYIVYEMTKKNPVSSYPTLENCLFGAVKLAKNPDIDNYKYSGYGIGFDRRGQFSFGDGFGQNVIIFGADMSSSVHTNNITRNILVLGKDFIQGIDNTTIKRFINLKQKTLKLTI